MAHEKPRFIRQTQNFLNRIKQNSSISTREISASRTTVGHKQSVANEGHIPHDMNHAGRGVAGSCNHIGMQCANLVAVTIFKQRVKLRPVSLKFSTFVEYFPKGILHIDDLTADPNLATQFILEIGGG